MAPQPWLVVLLVLALPWLSGEIRQATLDWFGLHATLALACGLGAVALKAIQPGMARRTGVIVLLLVCLTMAMVWQYVDRPPQAPFNWPDAIVGALGFVALPGVTAAIYATLQGGASSTFVQVTSLAIVAAPVSTALTLVVATLILR